VKEIGRLLEALGVRRDGAALIHSSFKGLSGAGYRAESVVGAMAEYMSGGTLLMPTMSWRSVNPEHPLFDELTTPSITGILTEVFRTGHASRRSLHPTHSVAGVGKLVDSLLATHHLDDTPCSARSPWGLLDDFDAQVVLLGVEMDSCTLVHHVEETIAPDIYLRPPETRERYICRDRNGKEFVVYTRRTKKLARNFWQFEATLAAQRGVRKADIAGTACIGFSAKDMVRVITDRLHQDPEAIIAKPGQRQKMM
jgi:aminoglycoside 3-N-acetyltransferase